MLLLLGTAAVGFAGLCAAQLTGRGFPDCDNGPLKNNTVCDQSAGNATFPVHPTTEMMLTIDQIRLHERQR